VILCIIDRDSSKQAADEDEHPLRNIEGSEKCHIHQLSYFPILNDLIEAPPLLASALERPGSPVL